MKNYLLVSLVALMGLVACKAPKDLSVDYLYFQDADSLKRVMTQFAEYKIRRDDILAIGIYSASMNAEQLMPFASVVRTEEDTKEKQAVLPNYTVDSEGMIQLPLVGKVSVAGLTRKEAQQRLEKELSNWISRPTVSVAVKNFSVTVLGEVRQPGRHVMPGTNVTLIDALAAAGDLTPYGNRREILLMRQNEGQEATFTRLDLTRAAQFMRPGNFQLSQNDVLYVPTNKIKVREAMSDEVRQMQKIALLLSGITTLSFLLTVFLR